MLDPETDNLVNAEIGPTLVTIPDVDTLEARVARIESMVADIHGIVTKIGPIVSAISQEMAEKGPVGMLGYLMNAMRQG